jgi:hypothetical protein
MRRSFGLLLAVLVCSLSAAACVPVPTLESQRSWTASPITVEPRGTRGVTTMSSQNSSQPSDSPASATPRPTRTPTRQPSPTPAPSPTPDPHRVVITEEDVRRSVTSGAAAQGGAQVEGLGVRFTVGKMRLTAQRLAYGPVNLSDLVLVGRLVARDGQLQLETESVQPGGLVGAFIPRLVNQVLAQYTSQYYVEEVRTLEGQLELRIR